MIHPVRFSFKGFAGKRIGLFGGSFNPAHEGHLVMSLFALKRLRLDEIWWLVSPQNPLKPKKNMAAFATRFRWARTLARTCKRIRVTGVEKELGTRYSVDTVKALQERMPRTCFVWIMGADNLEQINRWQRWEDLFRMVPIAVLRRSGYAGAITRCKAARKFALSRVDTRMAGKLAFMNPPAWLVLDNKLCGISATKLRNSIRKEYIKWQKKALSKVKKELSAKKRTHCRKKI